jgi:hypothetical protein
MSGEVLCITAAFAPAFLRAFMAGNPAGKGRAKHPHFATFSRYLPRFRRCAGESENAAISVEERGLKGAPEERLELPTRRLTAVCSAD